MKLECGRYSDRSTELVCHNKVEHPQEYIEAMTLVSKATGKPLIHLPCDGHEPEPTLKLFLEIFAIYESAGYSKNTYADVILRIERQKFEESLKEKNLKILELKKEIERLNFRTHLPNGDQIVVIGEYSYAWKDTKKPLQVGEDVVIPSGGVRAMLVSEPSTYTGTVTSIGSSYTGSLSYIISRA